MEKGKYIPITEEQYNKIDNLNSTLKKAIEHNNKAAIRLQEHTYKTFNQLIITSGGIAALAITFLGFLYNIFPNKTVINDNVIYIKISIFLFGLTIILAIIRNYYTPKAVHNELYQILKQKKSDIYQYKIDIGIMNDPNKLISELKKDVEKDFKKSNHDHLILNSCELLTFICFCLGIISLIIFTFFVL